VSTQLAPPARRLILVSTPLAIAAVSVFHPQDNPAELGGAVSRWMTVHLLQLVLSILLAACIWLLLDGWYAAAAGPVSW
jgi:hypothetical protein